MNGLPCGLWEVIRMGINPTVDPQGDCIAYTLEFFHQEGKKLGCASTKFCP